MKYTFTAALIFAFAKAQEEQDKTPCPFLENLVTTNELGQKELDLQIPEIAFSDVSESVIEDWASTKEQAYRELDQKLSDAWTNYQDAIAEPWNDLMSKASSLAAQREQLNAVTADEAITFVAENTFIDGKSLKSLFPQIESVLATLESEADTIEGRFNLDAFKITPKTLQRVEVAEVEVTEVAETEEPEEPQSEGSQDEDKDEASDSDSDSSSSESEADEADIREEALEKIEDAIITFGYDPQVVAEWFKNKSTSWEELIREQEMHNAVQAQADMAEAAEKVEDMLDSIVEELSAMDLETKADYEEALMAQVDELKALVGSRFDEQLGNIQDWIDQKQAAQKEEQPTESIEEELDEQAALMDLEDDITPVSEDAAQTTENAVADAAIAFASKGVKSDKQEESTSFFGYAGVSVGVVGVLAYMFGKKRTTVKALEQTTTDADEEFQLV